MSHRILAGIVAAAILTVAVAIAGCSGSGKTAPAESGRSDSRLSATLQDLGGAPAALSVSEPMRPFFAAGLGFIVMGGVVLCLGARGTGAVLLGLGVATTAVGVLFVQYPWTVLLVALAAGVLTAAAVYDRIRARRELDATAGELGRNREALEVTAQVIQNIPEGRAVKAALADLGPETEDKVRRVISPIKNKLRREGRIRDYPTAG